MTINCQKRYPKYRYAVYLNGKKIESVWRVDTRRGILWTYDVYESGADYILTATAPLIDPSWDAPPDGVLSKRMYGKIQLKKIGRWDIGRIRNPRKKYRWKDRFML